MIRLFAVLLIPTLLSAQTRLSTGMTVGPTVSLRIWVPAGTVKLQVWDRDSINVTGDINSKAQYFGGGGGTSAKLGIESKNLKDGILASGNLVVTVPRAAHVWVKMTDGIFSATGTTGELEVISVTGAITVTGATGVVSVETIDAKVNLSRIEGAVRVRGGSGQVTLADLLGTVTAETVSGALELTGQRISDARLGTINGPLTLRGALQPTAFVEMETHDGDMALHVHETQLPTMLLTSRAGKVNNPFSSRGGKQGRVEVHSFKGDINVLAMSSIVEGKSHFTP